MNELRPTPTMSYPLTAAQPELHGSESRYRPALPTSVAPRTVKNTASLDDPSLFFNRELSWLDFNWRVLYMALDERTPLLERLRFLAITTSNLDEFFRKRVGGLKRQVAANVRRLTPDGRMPEEQLSLIRPAVLDLYQAMNEGWQVLRPQLAQEAGLHVLDYEDLSEKEKTRLHAYFQTHIFPILTPLAVDPGRPFPFISNLSLSLAVTLRHPTRETNHFARIKVPVTRGRWVPAGRSGAVVPLEQVIAHNLHELFRGMDIVSVHPFKITRNADLRRDEEEADDLISMIADELQERRFAPVVRLEVDQSMPHMVRALLRRELDLQPTDVYENKGLLDYADFFALASLADDAAGHEYSRWKPVIPQALLTEQKETESIFDLVRNRDMLVHHPYESFRASTQRFLEEAARDPKVLAIKLTLYRTSDESPIVKALIRAAENGKEVAVLVEVKARFDEENNLEWGQKLESAGVHVTYGLVGLKTHTKTTLVIREEAEGLRTYCHLGTGNYHPKTANLYTDLGLITSRSDVGFDLINLFHYLTGYAPEQHYQRLLVAPRDMRAAFEKLIQQEIDHQEEDGSGRIVAKMNALDDVTIIQHLYRASQAGVQVDLIIRGHCRLRPGVEGFSDNIRVVSLIGRFLEHSRIFYFHNQGDPQVFMGSADWQRRNLDDRVEAIVDVQAAHLKARLIRILDFALRDRRQAWVLHPDGQYRMYEPASDEEALGFHQRLMQRAKAREEDAEAPWDII